MIGGISLEDIWREHRRFLMAVGGGAAVFLLALSAIARVEAGAAAVAKENRRAEREIDELADQLRGESFEAGLSEALARSIGPTARAAVELAPRPEFTLGAGDSPFIVYMRVREKVQSGTRGALLRRNIACPEDLGLAQSPSEDRVKEAVATADLADRVLAALLETGVRSIDVFRPAEPEYVALGAGAGEKADDAPVLRRLPVRFSVTATLDQVQALLGRFQRPGSCLELAAARIARAGDPAGGGAASEGTLLRAELEVAGLTLVPASEARLGAGSGAAAPGVRRGLIPRAGGRR